MRRHVEEERVSVVGLMRVAGVIRRRNLHIALAGRVLGRNSNALRVQRYAA
jgi:hypothetical protein